jgi:hypothetical protein
MEPLHGVRITPHTRHMPTHQTPPSTCWRPPQGCTALCGIMQASGHQQLTMGFDDLTGGPCLILLTSSTRATGKCIASHRKVPLLEG